MLRLLQLPEPGQRAAGRSAGGAQKGPEPPRERQERVVSRAPERLV